MTRTAIFEDAKLAIDGLPEPVRMSEVVDSIRAQLDFLISVKSGRPFDKGMLLSINMGPLAARTLEIYSLDVAQKIYDAMEEFEMMKDELELR